MTIFLDYQIETFPLTGRTKRRTNFVSIRLKNKIVYYITYILLFCGDKSKQSVINLYLLLPQKMRFSKGAKDAA